MEGKIVDLIIDKKQDIVSLVEDLPYFYHLGSVNLAFGELVSTLKEEFPGEEYGSGEYLCHTVISGMEGKEKKRIFGLHESGAVMHTIYDFLNSRNKIEIDLREVEALRIRSGLNVAFSPLSLIEEDSGMVFRDIQSMSHIVYGLLYYYAYYGYKLVKCEHCGRWFATTSFKNKYCSRKSTLPGYAHLNCEQAVRNIMQNCGRIKNRIETKAGATVSSQLYKSSFDDDFYKECTPLYGAAKANPTVENLTKYHSFLKHTEKERRWLKA